MHIACLEENNQFSKNLKEIILYGSLFFLFSCFFSLLIINISRLGLYIPVKLNFSIFFLVLSVAVSPFLLMYKERNLEKNKIFFKISSIILFYFLLPLVSFISVNLYLVIVSLSIILAFYRLKNDIFIISAKPLLLIVSFSFLFSISFVPHQIEFLFAPEATIYGYGGNQTMQSAAITNIIKEYNFISLGADGLENFKYKYHWGLYYWLAALGKISSSDGLFLIIFFRIAILSPAIFFSYYIFNISFLKDYSKSFNFFLANIFCFTIFDILGNGLHYDSETYGMSLVVFMLILPLYKFIIENNDEIKKINITYFLLIISILFLSCLKLTTGYLASGILFFIFFYKIKNKILLFITTILIVLIGIISLKLFLPSSYTGNSFKLMYFSYSQVLSTKNLFFLLIPTLFVIGFFYKIKCKNLYSNNILLIKKRILKFKLVYRWLINKNISWRKMIFVIYFFSILPFFFIPVGSVGIYNLIHLHWLFLPLFIIFIIKNENLFFKKFTFIIVIFSILSLNIIFKPAFFEKKLFNNFFIESSYNFENPLKIIKKNLENEQKIFSSKHLNEINNYPFKLILQKSVDYRQLYGKNFAVYVPEKNVDFWNILKGKSAYWCTSATLVIPAYAGVQLLKGIQDPKNCDIYIAGPSEYNSDSFIGNFSNNKICKYAQTKEINYIYRINNIKKDEDNFLVDCKKSYLQSGNKSN
jgi:hypothetical protein